MAQDVKLSRNFLLFVNFILIELFRLLLIYLETSDDTDIFQ